jgi:hypothetical protein
MSIQNADIHEFGLKKVINNEFEFDEEDESKNQQMLEEFLEVKNFLKNNFEPGGLSFIFQLSYLMIQSTRKKRLNFLTILFGIKLHYQSWVRILRLLDLFGAGNKILEQLCYFIMERSVPHEDLFAKNYIENLIISFCLLQFEFIAQSLTNHQFIYFLENLQKLLKHYYKKSYKNEFLYLKNGSVFEPESDLEWKEKSHLKEDLKMNKYYSNLNKSITNWINLMKSVTFSSKKYFNLFF